MTMHLITNFEARAGAETMLARYLSHCGESGAELVSLREVSAVNRARVVAPDARFRSFGARTPVGLAGAVAALAWRFRTDPPRRLVCWMYHAMVVGALATRLAGRPLPMFWMVRQALDDPSALSRSSRLAIAAAARFSAAADGILYNSERARGHHRARGFSDRNDGVIPNGFDLPAPPTPPARAPRVFGVAARVHPQKDHATFFAAAARLARRRPDVRFVLAGRGAATGGAEIEALIASSGVERSRVTLRGELADMAPFWREVDALVLSSRTEGFPNVVAEAMSWGRPVVTTDVGDAAAIVGETGWVVAPGRPDALAEAMEAIAALSAPEHAARAVAARRRVEERYAIGAVAARISAFLDAGRAGPDRAVAAAAR